MRRCAYTVHYKLYDVDEPKWICVIASSKAEAYNTAVYEAIPAKEKTTPYSAWVSSVTYNNGKYKTFNTFEGNPY